MVSRWLQQNLNRCNFVVFGVPSGLPNLSRLHQIEINNIEFIGRRFPLSAIIFGHFVPSIFCDNIKWYEVNVFATFFFILENNLCAFFFKNFAEQYMYEMEYNDNVSTENCVGRICGSQTQYTEFIPNEVFLITSDNCLAFADRTTLANNSDFFRSKFSGPDADDVAIKVDSVDGATLDILLDICYGRTISIDPSNMENIFKAANSLRFTAVLDGYVNLLLKNLNDKTIWQCLKIGMAFNLPKMIDVTHAFVVKNFPQIVHCTAEFVGLDARQLATFLRDDNLCVESEFDAFKAMLKWLNHSYVERLPFVPELLSTIRLTQLNIEILATNAAVLAKQANCFPLIEEAINWAQTDPARRNDWLLSFNPRPRCSTVDMNFHYVNSGGNGGNDRLVELHKQNRAKGRHTVTGNAV